MGKENGTKVGNFLRSIKGIAPDILEFAGNVTGIKALEKLGKMIEGDSAISVQDKELALKLLEFDLQEMQEVTKRWASDMSSDSWLSKNVRPLSLIFLTFVITLLMFTDSIESWAFDVKSDYIDLMKALLITVYFAYFGSRGYEKAKKIK
ncbi:MAG: hypothetical protein HRT69_13915 [Flavobacteriaceae bacterium]|nr:hypothetical protein [Flavobacteriaceae bacterium]